MKKLLLFLAILFVPNLARAQTNIHANLTTAGTSTSYTATSGLCMNLSSNIGSATIDLDGTWAGTVSFYGAVSGNPLVAISSVQNSASLTTQASSSTANGAWQFSVGAYSQICAIFTTATSGTVATTIQTALPSARGAGGAGGSGTINATNNVLPKRSSSTAFADSALTDDGTTVASTEPITSTGSITSGSNCTPAGATAVGGVCMTEAASTGWTPTAGFTYFRASTTHAPIASVNGASEFPLAYFGAGPAGSKCLHTSSTLGVVAETAADCTSGTVTNIATTSPLGGGAITSTGTLTCTTCTTNASALTSNVLIKGAGLQATQLSSITDNGTTVATTEEIDTGTAGGSIGFHGFLGATAESYNITGRNGVGIPVPYITPRPTPSAIAFDVFPHGSPSDFSSTTGVVWSDWCSTDIAADGTNYECLRLGKFSGNSAQVSTVKGGSGSVRNLLMQINGGGVGIGVPNGTAVGSLLTVTNDADTTKIPAIELDNNTTAEGYFATPQASGNFILGSAVGDLIFRGTGGRMLSSTNSTTPNAASIIYPGSPGLTKEPGNEVVMTADWTCGTGGTVSSCVAATIVGSTGVPLTLTLPLYAQSWDWDCDGVVGQATAATANSWNFITATNGATNVTASYTMLTAATATTGGATTDVGSTTSTQVIGPTWTLGGTATKMPFHVHGRIEAASASGTVLSLQLVAPTVGDLVTIYRGAGCRVK